jgi:hypothetical protein
MSEKIIVRRGLESELTPSLLSEGEFGLTTDSKKVFIGTSTGNVFVGPSAGGGTSAPSRTYVIDLVQWGITQGIPAKPWTSAHFTMANANVTGINNALTDAYNKGYDFVVLPRGQYAICYPNSIKTQANMTIDFNFSTLKVLYDSLNRSPLDTSTNPIYNFGGTSIIVNTPDTHIINLNLVGERAERAWTDVTAGVSAEARLETTGGVFFQTGSNRSSIRYSKIGFYMADAISTGFNGYTNIKSITDVEFGDIDATGTPIVGTDVKRVRSSQFIAIPTGTKIVSLLGLGYAPATSIPSGRYDAVFYKADNSFAYKTSNIRTRDPVIVPPNATQVKLTFVGDGTVDQGLLPNNPAYYALLVKDSISDGVVIEYNEIYGCHRGGLFLGSNNCLIRRNWFHDTGTMKSPDVYGLPCFTDFTCYSITSEDNYGHNCRIQENIIENTRLAIAMRGEFNDISRNEFKNCTYSLTLYNQEYLIFQGNTCYSAELHNFAYTGVDRHWLISGNIFDGSAITFTGTGTVANFSHNILKDGASISSTMDILIFNNNTVTNASVLGLGANTLIDKCTFIAGAKVVDQTTSSIGVHDKIIRCTFIDSIIDINVVGVEATVRDSTLRNTYCQLRANGTKWILKNCKVDNTTGVTPIGVIYSPTYAGLGRTKEKLEIYNSDIKLATSLVSANEMWSIVIRDSKITYTLTANLTQGFVAVNSAYGLIDISNSTIQSSNAFTVVQDIGTTIDYINKGNTFTSFSLNNPTSIQSDLMTAEPTKGTYKLADVIKNNAPAPGNYLGWICTTAGVANASTWAATTDYRIWNQITVNGFVYQTDLTTSYTIARSCKTIPVFPTTVGQTVADTVGATTWTASTTYTVGAAVLPPTSNGFWYECTAITTGTSGATAPTFPTAGNVVDSGVTWTTRKIITWSNVGAKAVFKPYGLISE